MNAEASNGTAAEEIKVLYYFPALVHFKPTEEGNLCSHCRPRDTVLTASSGFFCINMIKEHFLYKKKLNIQSLITRRMHALKAFRKALTTY